MRRPFQVQRQCGAGSTPSPYVCSPLSPPIRQTPAVAACAVRRDGSWLRCISGIAFRASPSSVRTCHSADFSFCIGREQCLRIRASKRFSAHAGKKSRIPGGVVIYQITVRCNQFCVGWNLNNGVYDPTLESAPWHTRTTRSGA